MSSALLIADDYELDYDESSRQIKASTVRERSSRSKWTTRCRYRKRTGKDASLSSGSHKRRLHRKSI